MTHHPDHEVELYKDEGAYQVYVHLPGYDREDVDLRWHDGRLHVVAEHREEDGEVQVFNRDVSVPRKVDADEVSATFEDDVLSVRLPIVEGERPGRRIEVGD